MEQVQEEGARTVKRMIDSYNLDAIIAVGYRVRKALEWKGTISHRAAIEKAEQEYEIFRIKQDANYISEFDKQIEKYLKGD